MHNSGEDPVQVDPGYHAGTIRVADEEESLFANAFTALDSLEFGEPHNPPPTRTRASHTWPSAPRPFVPSHFGPSVIQRWMMLVTVLLARCMSIASAAVCIMNQSTAEVTAEPVPASVEWHDLKSQAYKEALSLEFDTYRDKRYGHLSQARFELLRDMVMRYSHTIVIDGVVPSTVDGYEFDIELQPGAEAVRHQLPKMSPQMVEREKYHVEKEMKLGHLRVPTDEQKSDWATRTHIVSKKDDPMGRWICDFRPLNRVTKKRMTAIGDVFSKTRSLASKKWKSGLDAWSGFNQLNATERARRYMQIITSLGMRQWTVLAFGVTNGPSYFQEFMLNLYGGVGSTINGPLPDMTGATMIELDSILEVWIDDIQLGSGTLDLSKVETEAEEEAGFRTHLVALERVLARAATANLRFKMSKCFFAQFSLETLGMVAGIGVVKADPKKIQAIVGWPRPNRLEDVERFLATTVFIREHLSPRYSQISKPLRDALAVLQQKRKDKMVRGKARYLPPSKPPPNGAWPDWWTQELEDAFIALKQLVVNAVELQVPDFPGAMDGSNLLHIWPDACNYGIGAGLFQGYPKDVADRPDSHYHTLGVPSWSTKGEIVGRYGELKRTAQKHCAVDMQAIEDAYAVLSDVQARIGYDESLGLAAKRKTRIDLRPLGFFSKSLSRAQQSWPTWERELLAVLLTLMHFRTVCTGMIVVIHTDHLNNTVLGANLTSPDKILRMLLKIEGLVTPRWQFAPGNTQSGDGWSRNPPDRDLVRGEAEDKTHMPKTLGEAFAAATGTAIDGVMLNDNADDYTQQFVNSAHMRVDPIHEVDRPSVLDSVLVASCVRAQVIKPKVPMSHVLGVVIPSRLVGDGCVEQYDGYTVAGKDISIKGEVVIKPPVVCGVSGLRWLEEYAPPPRSKQVQKRLRTVFLDGILSCLRVLVQTSLLSVLAFGEGAIVVVGLLSPELRTAAYKERRVTDLEANDLEQVAKALQNVVLICPHALPVTSYMPLLREYVPEITSVIPNSDVQVLVVGPIADNICKVVAEMARSVHGALTESITIKGPAYRVIPPGPLVLRQLYREMPVQRLPLEILATQPPRETAEAWAGKASFTTELVRVGFIGRAYECAPNGSVYLPEGDMHRAENQAELHAKITGRSLFSLHGAPCCKSWSTVQNMNETTRTQDVPEGDGSLEHEIIGNKSAAVMLWLTFECVRYGVYVSLEHPLTSRLWKLPIIKFLIDKCAFLFIVLDQCAFGKRPGDWDPTQGDVRTLKGTAILTNNGYLRSLQKRCADTVKHYHRAVLGKSNTGENRSAESAAYPQQLAAGYAMSTRTAWLHGTRPSPIPELPHVTLQMLIDHVGLDPMQIPAAPVARALRSSPGASSSADPLPAAVAPPPAAAPAVDDYWMETDTDWIRIHVVPRHTYFYPLDCLEGPKEDALGDLRVTHLVFLKGNRRETQTHAWRDTHHAKGKTREKWTGRSVFRKAVAPPTDSATPDTTGMPIVPGTPMALRAGLAGMRGQMAVAQRKDPRLLEIIKFLQKEPAGSYMAEPRGAELRKIKVRALKYRLTSDKLLVARGEEDELGDDLPVVPDVVHESVVPGAPKSMTWRHVLLGAVHNTPTGEHRRATEMRDELKNLVSWYPPERLLRDCTEWRERCKLCTSVHSRPRHEPHFHAVRAYKPFYRLQIDLLELKPTGPLGEKYVMTCICVATRYIFLRACGCRDAPELAILLLDVILDCGVVPAVIQSDNEFCNLAFEELCTLLGSTQIFSTALRPQSQGIVERSHRDIRSQLAILVDTYVRSNPRKWPTYLRFVEHKLRHKTLVTGVSPYSAIHGFLGSSALSTALGAIEEMPEDMIWADWLHAIVSETKTIAATLSEHWATEAATRARRHAETKPEPDFVEGELVLLSKAFFEKGVGAILPQCDGPFTVCRLPTTHTALLTDTLTGEPIFDGRPVSVARLIRFHFPVDWGGPEAAEVSPEQNRVRELRRGSFCAVSPRTSQYSRIHVARVERIFVDQNQAEVTLFWVPPGCRTGPWQARRWGIWHDDDGVARKEIISEDELICPVELNEDALTQESLERLTLNGVPASHQPRRDSTLPPANI